MTADAADVDSGRTVGFGLPYPRTMLGLCAAGWIAVQTGRYVLPPLAPALQATFGIDNAAFGVALSVLWASYALAQFPAGLASDDLGYKTALVGSLLAAGLAFGAFPLATAYPVWLALLAVAGVGAGVFLIASRAFLSALYGDAKGTALGVHSAAGDVGGVIAPLGATAVLAVAVWWLPFAVVFAVAVAAAALLHVTAAGSYAVRRPAVAGTARAAARTMAAPDLLVLVGVYGVYVLVTQGIAAFVPLFLVELSGLSQRAANVALSLFFLVAVGVKPVAGWVSDRIGRRPLTVGALVGAAVPLFALPAVEGLPAAALVVAFGAVVRLFPTPTQAYLFDRFDEATSGSAFGLARTGYVLVGATGPTVVGVGSETVGFAETIPALGGALLLSAAVFGVLSRSGS